MRKKGQTKNRPEQLLAKKIIDALLKANNHRVDSHLEYEIIDIQPVGGDKLHYTPKVDIAYFFNRTKVAVELLGGYHDSLRQQLKDETKFATMAAKPNEWEIIKFKDAYMQYLFKRNTQKLNYDEFILAYGEIHTTLKDRFNLKTLLPDSELKRIFDEQ